MKHQPFETWLLSDDPLDGRSREALQAHMLSCPRCGRLSAALQDIEGLLQSAPMHLPESGFVERFQARLADRQDFLWRRQIWIFLAASLAATSFVGMLLGLRWLVFAPSLSELVAGSVYGLSWFYTLIEAGREVLLTLLRIAPPVWLGLFIGAVSGLMMMWIYSVGKFRLSRIWRVA